jgi:tetratricopeptide (TPR) repeat protein
VSQAERRRAYREALTILGSLVELLPPGDERWLEVLDALVLEAEWVVDHRADVHAAFAIPALRAIDSLLGRSPDPARRAAIKFRLASFLAWGTGELEEADRSCEEARALFEQAGDNQGTLLASLELAFIAGFKGNSAGELTAVTQVAEAAEAAGDRLVTMRAVGRGLGWANFFCGRFDAAEAALRRALTMAREDGKVYFQTLCVAGLARTLAFDGRVEEAFPLLEGAKAADPGWRDGILGEWEIIVQWLAGDLAAGSSQARDLVAWNASGMSRRRAIGIAFACLSASEAGQMADAHRYLDVARTAYGNRPWGIWAECAAYAEAVLAWHHGEQVVAGTDLRRTAERILEMGGWPWAAFVLLDLAEVAAESRDSEAAAWAADRLYEVAGQVDRHLYRALAGTGRAWSQLASGGPEAAAEAAEEAVGILSGMGYRIFLGRALDVFGRAMVPIDRSRADALERPPSTPPGPSGAETGPWRPCAVWGRPASGPRRPWARPS